MSEVVTLIGSSSGEAVEVDHKALRVQDRGPFEYAIANGDAFSWAALTYNYTAIDTILAVQNTSSTRDLVIQEIHIAGDAASQAVVFTASGTDVAGTNAVVGVNLNRNSGKVAPASAIDDETGYTESTAYAGRLYAVQIAADTTLIIPVNGAVVLPHDHMIGVDLTTVGAAANVSIIGYYVDR